MNLDVTDPIDRSVKIISTCQGGRDRRWSRGADPAAQRGGRTAPRTEIIDSASSRFMGLPLACRTTAN